MLNSDKRYDLVLHRTQQYLGLKQYTIPVNNSTPERKCHDPLVRWFPQVSTCVLDCSTLEYAWLDSRVIYRHLRKILVFKSVRKIFRIF